MQEQIITDRQLEIINGSLLGDGYISNPRYGNSYFNKNQCLAHTEYLAWHYDELLPHSLPIKFYDNRAFGKTYRRGTFNTRTSKIFSSLRSLWYPYDIKIIPRNLILTPLTIAVWFFDDGSNNISNRSCKFATYCFKREECEFLCELLAEFNIRTSISGNNEIRVLAESYKVLVDLVRPYMLWECFEHKINYRDAQFTKATESEKNIICYLHDQGKNGREIAKIIGKSTSVISATLRRNKGIFGLNLNNTSGIKGISWDKGRSKWKVYKIYRGKTLNIGRFNTIEEAKLRLELHKI